MKRCARFALPIAAAILAALPAHSQQTDPLQRGRRLFLQCAACHSIGTEVAGKIGPALSGVVGRPAGRFADPKPSPALAAVDFRWTPERLDAWLAAPQAVAPGTSMLLVGIDNMAARADLIAYLTSLR